MVTSTQAKKDTVLLIGILLASGCATFMLHTSSASALVGLMVTVVLPFFIAAMLGVAKTTTP